MTFDRRLVNVTASVGRYLYCPPHSKSDKTRHYWKSR